MRVRLSRLYRELRRREGFKTVALCIVGASVMLTSVGCATNDSAVPASAQIATAMVTPADMSTAPPGTRPAVLWTIDGYRVESGNRPARLSAGTHMISVLPLQKNSIKETKRFAIFAYANNIEIIAIPVQLEAGQNLTIAAVVRRHRTYAHEEDGLDPLEPWQTTIYPYPVLQSALPVFSRTGGQQ